MNQLTDHQFQFLKALRDYFAGSEFESMFDGLESYVTESEDECLIYLAPAGTSKPRHRRVSPLPVQGKVFDDDGEVVYLWPFFDEARALAEIEIWKPSGKELLSDPFSRAIELEAISGRQHGNDG